MQNHTADSDSSDPLVEKNDQVNLISRGPLLHEVASQLLRRMLKESYPDLKIDPDKTMIGFPQWQVVDGQVEKGPLLFESLTFALMQYGLDGTTADFIEGEQFLTLEPQTEDPVQLSVGIEDIARTLNQAAAILFVELQDRQLNYWNATSHGHIRWQALSNSLRKAFNVKQVKGWDANECAMARAIFADPDRETRANAATGFTDLKACLIDIDIVENGKTRHLLMGGALVAQATYDDRKLIVMYTVDYGYESFSTLEKLGDSLPQRLDRAEGTELKWRLYEPDGDVFDHMALALVSSQIESIDSLGHASEFAESAEPESGLDTDEQAHYKTLDAAIPQWLRKALPNDLDDYRRYITALGKLYRDPKHQVARLEIPSMARYAHQKMKDAIIADKRADAAAKLPWDQLRIKITNSFTVDNLVLPNPHDQHTETLAEYAMENDAPYMASLSFKTGEKVPAWLTAEFLTEIAGQVDIGSAYPALIKRQLIDDPLTSKRQASLHREQLHSLLPLKALEGKIKKEAGIDEQGYQIICEWMDGVGEANDDIALYALSMTPQHRLIRSSDTVTNMYIISPRVRQNAPCLLYRPMQDTPLMQFPSRQNLLYALHQPGELRDSILAWLPSKTLSFEYSQYVFPTGWPSPWLTVEELVNPTHRADQFGRVVLDGEEITGNVLSELFKRNAQALVTLADRQSQSNAERRWTLLKDSSWALFGAAANCLSGAVGTAVWAWQTIEQIQQTVDAHKRGDTFVQWKSTADILLALGILLSHHAAMRHKALSSKLRGVAAPVAEVATSEQEIIEPVKEVTEPEAEITEPVQDISQPVKDVTAPSTTTITLDPDALVGKLPSAHEPAVDPGAAVPRRTPAGLVVYLDSLQVTLTDLKSDDAAGSQSAARYLHKVADKTYAQVGKRWFNVSVNEDADADPQLQILDPKNSKITGPYLTADPDGRWVMDLRMRLRGAGPTGRLKALKAANELRRTELKKELHQFQRRKLNQTDEGGTEIQKQAQVRKAQADYVAATDENRDQLSATFTEQLDDLISAYQKALEQSKEWHNLGGGPGYINDSLRMHTELQKYISIWFAVKRNEYALGTRLLQSETTITQDTRDAHVVQVKHVTDLSEAMVKKLSISQKALDALNALGRAGIEQASNIHKLLPSFTEWDLKANEIGIAQELCMEEPITSVFSHAHDQVGDLLYRGAGAAHRVSQLLKGTPGESTPQGQVEELSAIIDTFADVDQRLGDLPESYPGAFKQSQLEHLRGLLGAFAAHAQSLRSSLLDEDQIALRKEPSRPSTSGGSRQTVKIRKTRPRQPAKEETAPEAAAPIGAIALEVRQRPTPTLDDRDIISTSLNLVLEAPAFIKRTLKDADKPSRIPADMQDIFDQQASKLEQSAASVDEILARTKEFPVHTLGEELRAAAVTMRESGISVRANLYKLRKPTQSTLRWMHENGQIKLLRDKGRIKTKQLGDYFQEYRVLDKKHDDKELWVAHFHYESLKSPVGNPTAAHLKIADTYLQSLTAEQQKTLTTFEPVDGVLRKINDADVRQWFFDLEPPARK
ncbi:dermonecrotic toxin domain-containing protein [Pseudomonas sp. TMB3-21]